MRATAEVGEAAGATLLIEGDRNLQRQVLDQPGLVGVGGLVVALEGGVPRQGEFRQGQVVSYDGAHPLLDHREIFGRQAARQIEIVVKAAGDDRADTEFHLVGAEPLGLHLLPDRLGHDVGQGVAHEFDDPLVALGEHGHLGPIG